MKQETSNTIPVIHSQTNLEDFGSRKNFPVVIGEWTHMVNYDFDNNGKPFYNVQSSTFIKEEFYGDTPITILQVMPDKEELHLLILSTMLEHIKENNRLERIKLGMQYNPEPTESTEESSFREQEILHRITKENGPKSILEIAEEERLNSWESLSA